MKDKLNQSETLTVLQASQRKESEKAEHLSDDYSNNSLVWDIDPDDDPQILK